MTPINPLHLLLQGFYRALADNVTQPIQYDLRIIHPERNDDIILKRTKKWGTHIDKIFSDHRALCDNLQDLEEEAIRGKIGNFAFAAVHFNKTYATLLDDISKARIKGASFFHFPHAHISSHCHGYAFNPTRTGPGAFKQSKRLGQLVDCVTKEDLSFGIISPTTPYSCNPELILAGKDKSYLGLLEFTENELEKLTAKQRQNESRTLHP